MFSLLADDNDADNLEFLLQNKVRKSDDSYQCRMCSKSIKRISDVKKHMAIVHSVGALPESADVNSLMTSSVRVLENGHHLCLICDKTNKQRGSMQPHMREVHAKCEEYLCPYCNARFSSRSVFYSHFMRVHKTDVPDKISNFRVK